MGRTILHSLVLAALAGVSTLALADPPAVVGRISSVQGQVTVGGDGEPAAAILNWPVTVADHISTTRGGRAEFRVGSTAVRVDGDSDLEITDLDDDLLRLRLNYGSVIVRVKNPDLLRNFELSTPEARVTLIEPGEIRVDADRTPDTSAVNVLHGSARVDGAGSTLALANGRRAEVSFDDVRTGLAARDYFDIWAQGRDSEDDAAIATRYIPPEVTGYEELDRNGSWSTTTEYGPVWTPRVVAADWAPYRDGQWIWREPWGWTWVDNAPWGYAPSHYGRWVLVGARWCWAPGRIVGRPVWAPALVGWVGGDQLLVRGRSPGLGWYPLGPRDHYVPPYRVSVEIERRLTWNHTGRPDEWRERRWDERHDHRDGVTVLPRDQFEARRNVPVNRGPAVVLAPAQVTQVVQVTAPQAPAQVKVVDHNRRDWQERRDWRERGQQPAGQPAGQPASQPVRNVNNVPQQQLQPQTQPQTQQLPQPQQPVQTRTLIAPANPVVNEDRVNGRFDRGGRYNEEPRRQQHVIDEQTLRDQQARERAQREQAQRDQQQREQAQRDQAQQQTQREQVQRDQAQREQAQRAFVQQQQQLLQQQAQQQRGQQQQMPQPMPQRPAAPQQVQPAQPQAQPAKGEAAHNNAQRRENAERHKEDKN